MSGLFIFGVIFLAVVCMVIAISKFNMHPFLVLTVIAVLVGLVCGIPTEEVISTVKSGFGNILASIGIVILAGTIIGTILEKTGAALTMANTILKIVGKEKSVLTMGITGYITGIPVFCDSGFVILSPISRALASQSNVSLAVMATALSGGLSMIFKCTLMAPHGGIFVFAVVGNWPLYLLSLVAGTALSTVLLGVFKKNVSQKA